MDDGRHEVGGGGRGRGRLGARGGGDGSGGGSGLELDEDLRALKVALDAVFDAVAASWMNLVALSHGGGQGQQRATRGLDQAGQAQHNETKQNIVNTP